MRQEFTMPPKWVRSQAPPTELARPPYASWRSVFFDRRYQIIQLLLRALLGFPVSCQYRHLDPGTEPSGCGQNYMVVTNGTGLQGSEALILLIIQLPELRQRLPVLGVRRDCLAMFWGDLGARLVLFNGRSLPPHCSLATKPSHRARTSPKCSSSPRFGLLRSWLWGRLPNFYAYPTVQAGSGRNLFGNEYGPIRKC